MFILQTKKEKDYPNIFINPKWWNIKILNIFLFVKLRLSTPFFEVIFILKIIS